MVVAILLVFASVFAFVMVSGDKDDDRQAPDPQTVGTSGDRMPRDGSPGGFNPTPRPNDTQGEIDFRGSDLLEVGRPAHFDATVVERADGGTFWVRDNGKTIQVVAPGGTPTVKAGQRVDIDGTVEAGGDSPRVKATRIEVK